MRVSASPMLSSRHLLIVTCFRADALPRRSLTRAKKNVEYNRSWYACQRGSNLREQCHICYGSTNIRESSFINLNVTLEDPHGNPQEENGGGGGGRLRPPQEMTRPHRGTRSRDRPANKEECDIITISVPDVTCYANKNVGGSKSIKLKVRLPKQEAFCVSLFCESFKRLLRSFM